MVLLSLENALLKYKKDQMQPQNVPEDRNADPRKWNNTWVPWQDCEDVQTKHIGNTNITPTGIAVLATLCSLFLIVILILISLSVKSRIKKADSSPEINNEENLDVPTSVIHVKPAEKNDGFENSEHVRQNSIRHDTKRIE